MTYHPTTRFVASIINNAELVGDDTYVKQIKYLEDKILNGFSDFREQQAFESIKEKNHKEYEIILEQIKDMNLDFKLEEICK